MREQTEKSRAYYRERGIAIRGMETEAERKEGEMKLKIVRTKSESEGGRSYMRAIILQGMRVGLGIRVDVRNETDTSICPVQSITSYHIIVLHRVMPHAARPFLLFSSYSAPAAVIIISKPGDASLP
jgi:hypothetical protein